MSANSQDPLVSDLVQWVKTNTPLKEDGHYVYSIGAMTMVLEVESLLTKHGVQVERPRSLYEDHYTN
jgi:hypothetical protein